MANNWGVSVRRLLSACRGCGIATSQMLGLRSSLCARYQAGNSDYHLPARLSSTRYQNVLRIAERAARALGTTGAVRADMLVTDRENEYVLEINTLPGMTENSLLPKIARGAGYDFGGLCEAILDRATLQNRRGLEPAAVLPSRLCATPFVDPSQTTSVGETTAPLR